MPNKVCGFGFDCGSMLLQPGLEPAACPNYTTCGRATRLTPDEEIELIRVRQVQRESAEHQSRRARQEHARRQEVWRTTRRQIALEMLMQRGCPQTPQQYIPNDTFEQLTQAIVQIQTQLAQFEGTYIPPAGTIAHRYWVHRPHKSYPYNKLMATTALFAPAQEEHEVRMIHLSRDDDPRNLEARKGITRMHRLIVIRAQLQVAQAALGEALALAQASVEPFGVETADSEEPSELNSSSESTT